ncbi:MAG: pilus assembly protein PilM [Deltaproteobacteria bacterium]|nr:pilus assembly protein PilM [Deltaproteobacteria bacterium]
MFKSLLPLKKPDLLGVDPGTHCVKIVKISRVKTGKLSVDFCGLYPIPRSSPDFTSDLHEVIKANGFSGLSAAVCLDDPGLKIRKMELPAMPDADLKEAVRWNMRDAVEGPVTDYSISSSPIGESAAGGKIRRTWLGYAVKKKSVVDLMNLITRIGLKPAVIEPSVVTLAAVIDRVHPSEDHWTGGIDLGAEKISMGIIGNGRFYFSRPLSGMRVDEARDNLSEFMKKLAAEIQNTLDTFSVTFQQGNVNRIYLSGGGAGFKELPEYLSKNLAVPTEVLDPFSGMELSDAASKTVAGNKHLFSQAASLACL